MPSGKPTKPSSAPDARTNPITLERFEIAEPDATLHDRDGKQYDAKVLNTFEGKTKRGHSRKYALLRYRLRPNEWVDVTAVHRDSGDIQGRKWYEMKPSHLSKAEVDAELAKIKAREKALLASQEPEDDEPVQTQTVSQNADSLHAEHFPSEDQELDPEKIDESADVDLSSMDKSALVEYAKAAGIAADNRWGKQKLIDAIKAVEL